jgi:hypothetical protein
MDTDKRLDLTTALSDLTHKKGSIKIDKLYIYMAGYDETMENYGDIDEIYLPSYHFAELPCEITTTSKESVKLGKDTKAVVKSIIAGDIDKTKKTTITAKSPL